MNIYEASDLFKKLITETDEESEIRVYHQFISILSDLENKTLTDEQLLSIERELDTINLNVNSKNRKEHFKLKLKQFVKFLKENTSLISEGHYAALGTGLGICFGVAFGASFDNVAYGLISGMLIGLIIGAVIDSKAKKEGKVLKTK